MLRGFILVGGASSRMGKPKGRLTVAGTTLVDRTASALATVCSEITLLGSGYEDMGYPWLPDAVPGIGPAGGILTALRTGTGWKLVVACDMPGVTPDLLASIAAECSRPGIDSVIPVDAGGSEHPLCAAYHSRCLPEWEKAVVEGVRTVRAIVSRLPAFRMPVTGASLLRNVNTPAEWEEFIRA